ncbi:hypothetical protein [Pseudomethylobacillus aquaticus]|nr:hypothetical protein [Pseudomethylobacillus aquaticus]
MFYIKIACTNAPLAAEAGIKHLRQALLPMMKISAPGFGLRPKSITTSIEIKSNGAQILRRFAIHNFCG